MNRATLIGHLGRDPEGRSTNSGGRIVSLSVATSERWRDRNSGERREATEWHRVVVFNEHAATFAEQYLRKGAKVLVEGQIKTRKWQDQQGQERYTTEIVIGAFNGQLVALDRADDAGGSDPGERSGRGGRDAGRSAGGGGFGGGSTGTGRGGGLNSDLDDDIPF